MFDVAPIGDGAGFAARETIWPLGSAILIAGRSAGVRFQRSAARIRRDQCDHFTIAAWRSGATRASSDGWRYEAGPGSVTLYSLRQPLENERSPNEAVKLFLARDALPHTAAAALDARLRTRPLLEGGIGGLLFAHLDALARALEGMSAVEAKAAAEATLLLVRAAVARDAEEVAEARPILREAARARVIALIRRDIASARLAPERLARQAGLSRSQLYRVFEADGGVARAIQRERLRAIARALAEPAERRTVAALAEAFGMPDASAFSRAFRRHFGVTPREYREAALLDMAPTWPASRPGAAAGAGFPELLRGLGA